MLKYHESGGISLLFSDESKFLSKKVIHTSMLPTVGNRTGIFVMLSSAHESYSEYQRQIGENVKQDIKDLEDFNIKIDFETWDNKDLDLNRVDNIKSYAGRRHFQQHWEDIILENQGYALAVSRALQAVGDNRDAPSFATQYDNKFLSIKSASFFDIQDLRINIPKVFETENVARYENTPNYFLVGGWDIAVTGDNSLFIIKAIESGYGESRKSKVLYQYLLNPNKDKNKDSVYNQCRSAYQLMVRHKLEGLVIDESGVGKSAKSYIMDIVHKERYFSIDQRNMFDIVITQGNRTDLLDYYYKRIQAGLESFNTIPKEWENEEFLKSLYLNAINDPTERGAWIRFVYEHSKFTRTEIMDDKTGLVKIDFRQSEENFLHDDSILASCLCSRILKLNPTITNYPKVKISNNKGINNGARFSR